MKALLVKNEELVLSEVAQPVPGEEEVLVRVRAAGVNRADVLQRHGKYPSPAGCPPWPGLEIAGEVVEVGAVAAEKGNWKIGDGVCALLGGGGYAEYAVVRYDMLLPVPRGFSFARAAALPEVWATSYLNLFEEGHLEAGQTAFIPAGTSGLATAAIPLARAFGARVITTVRNEASARAIAALGADRVIISAGPEVAAALKEEEEAGHPVNVAMDCLSGDALGESLPYMARGGYWVVISTLAGIETKVPLRPLLTKGLHLVGSMLRNRTPAFKAEVLAALREKVWPLLENGTLKTSEPNVLPFAEAMEAHRRLEAGGNVGKIVLIPE